MKKLNRNLIAIYFSLLLYSCSFYDPDLQTPDCCGGGYIFTPLGALVDRPWQAEPIMQGKNVSVFCNGQLLSSIGTPYSKEEKKLIFQLYKHGNVEFWNRPSYSDVSEADLKNLRENVSSRGSWVANYTDSSIKINLGEGKNKIIIEGKIMLLGSSVFKLRKTSTFDSLINGTVSKCISETNISYGHF